MDPVIAPTSTLENPIFQDLRVDNEGFFAAVEDKLTDVFSPDDMHERTRRDLKGLLAEMRKQQFIRWVTEWTAREQSAFFQNIRDEINHTSVLFSSTIRTKMKELIEQELWREINDDGVKIGLQDGGGNTILPTLGDYQYFLQTSFLVERNTTIIPMNLHLTVSEEDTIQNALRKLDQYQNKYNALILIDAHKRPIGVVTRAMIERYEWFDTLKSIEPIANLSGGYMTSPAEARSLMQEHGVNILPIVDSLSGVLIGILTIDSLVRKEAQYYSTVSLTELSLDYLKSSTPKI